MKMGIKPNFHQVVSAGKSGQQMDITVRVRYRLKSAGGWMQPAYIVHIYYIYSSKSFSFPWRAPKNKAIVHFSSRRVEGHLLANEAKENGDFEICFINRFVAVDYERKWTKEIVSILYSCSFKWSR